MSFPYLNIYTDGGARGNPGPAAIGVVIKTPDGVILQELEQTIGNTTNNVAEYQAVIVALETLLALDVKAEKYIFHLDSELVSEQLKGNYKVKKSHLRSLREKVHSLVKQLNGLVEYQLIPREANSHADHLVNEALDRIN